MAKAKTVDCPNCGAPLQVEPRAQNATCQYCQTTSVVDRGKAPPRQLQQWQTPAVGAQPMMPAPMPMVVHIPKQNFGWIIWMILITTLLPVLIGMFATFGASGGSFGLFGWDGEEPFSCGGNERHSIDDVTAKFKGTAMTVGGNCRVELRDVNITGKTAIKVAGNGTVVLHSGKIKGTKIAFLVESNGHAILHDGEVEGEDYAFDVSGNGDVDTGGASIEGKQKTSVNGKIDGERQH